MGLWPNFHKGESLLSAYCLLSKRRESSFNLWILKIVGEEEGEQWKVEKRYGWEKLSHQTEWMAD